VSLRKHLKDAASYVQCYKGAVPSEGAELVGIDCSGINFPLHVKVHYGI